MGHIEKGNQNEAPYPYILGRWHFQNARICLDMQTWIMSSPKFEEGVYKMDHRGGVSTMKTLLRDEGDSFEMIFIVRNLKMIKNWNFYFTIHTHIFMSY